MSTAAQQDERTSSPIPEDAGLESGTGPAEPSGRSGRELVDAAANGGGLTEAEHGDLLDYYLSNNELPGDADELSLTVELGHRSKRTFSCVVHPIDWDEWQDARQRATSEKTGRFDAFISSSWTVARALVTPKLGPTVARLQSEDPKGAPSDAAHLLRRMFAKQSGALLELSGKVLEISRLQDDANSVKEVEAAKNSS